MRAKSIAGAWIVFVATLIAQNERATDEVSVIGIPPGVSTPVVRAWFYPHTGDRGRDIAVIDRMLSWDRPTFETAATLEVDAAGQITLPSFPTTATIAVWTNDRFGVLTVVSGDSKRGGLVLRDDRTVHVQVVDSNGRPCPEAEVTVEVRQQGASSYSNRRADNAGLVVVPHAQTGLRGRRRDGDLVDVDPLIATIAVGLGGIFAEEFEPHLFPWSALDAPPIRIVMPDACRVVVHVNDASGARCKGEVRIAISLFEKDERLRRGLHDFEVELAEDGMDGECIAYIRPGERIRVWAAARRYDFEPAQSDWLGPTTSGGVLEVALKLETPRPKLVGRAVTREGTALDSVNFDAFPHILDEGDTESDEVSWDLLNCGSDTNGRFEIELSGLLGICRIEGDRLTAIRLVGNVADGRRYMALIPVPPEPKPGPSEIGDVIFAPLPVLLSGSVVDSDGRPIADASIEVIRSKHCRNAETGIPLGERLRSIRSDAAGRFGLGGASPGILLALVVEGAGYADAWVDQIECGTMGVTITLRKAATVRARVLLEPKIDADHLVFALIGEPARVAPGSRDDRDLAYWSRAAGLAAVDVRFATPDEHGFLEWKGLHAGRARLEVRVAGSAAPLLAIPDIQVEEGMTTADPRLLAVDLVGRLAVTRLSLFGGPKQNDALRLESIVADRSDSRPRASWSHQVDGNILVTAKPRPPLIGRAKESRWFRIDGGVGDIRLACRPGIEVAIDLGTDPRALFGEFEVMVALDKSTEPGFESLAGAGVFLSCRGIWNCDEIRFTLPGTGRYRISLSFTGGVPVPIGAKHDPDAVIEVVEPAQSGQVQRFALAVDFAPFLKLRQVADEER